MRKNKLQVLPFDDSPNLIGWIVVAIATLIVPVFILIGRYLC